ncbi:MAG: preprotein translocase subunit SecG [Candidatus Eisenbacteria bacterium]|nr:preprotein translocase subunit SecG [Candidatus Eisenbacteria bacterium]
MFGVVIGIHVLICALLMVVVLLQSGKGGGLAGAFGGAGGIGAVFGGQSAATFLTKATRYLAIGFMLTSLLLALMARGTFRGGAVETGVRERAAAPASGVEGAVPSTGVPTELPGSEGAGERSGTQAPAETEGTSEPGSP